MKPTQLLAHFDRISKAPDAVPCLRGFILDLAMRGKLIEQRPPDAPVCILKSTTKNKPDRNARCESNGDDSWPYRLPTNWKWMWLENISVQITDGEHATPPRIEEQQGPLVTAKNVRDRFMDYSDTDWVSFDTAEKDMAAVLAFLGDILMVCVGATTGRQCILRNAKDMVLVRSVALIRPKPEIYVEYLAMSLRSPFCQDEIWRKVKVSAQPCLYINRINSLPIPLPPLAEQHRIVAKVGELMALCNRAGSAARHGPERKSPPARSGPPRSLRADRLSRAAPSRG
jgi:type I restriction enzyme S subunit